MRREGTNLIMPSGVNRTSTQVRMHVNIDRRQVDIKHNPGVMFPALSKRGGSRRGSNYASSQSDEERSELGVEGDHLDR